MRSFLIVSSLLVLCLAVGGCGNGGTEGETGETEGTQTGQAGGAQTGQMGAQQPQQMEQQPMQQQAMQPVPFEQRQQWMTTVETQLQQMDQRLESLDAQVMQLPPEQQQDLLGNVNELKQTRVDLREQWTQLQSATADDWNDKLQSFQDKFQDYQQNMMQLQQRVAAGGHGQTGQAGGTGM